ncbi:Nebulin-family actin filament anchoring protein Cyk3 [Schizosaccharomyces osmophilus]|uniref:Nebulin-family actin filament anchoring protein Cyk3 n=1 Tax=Schizosaccharomyces osmophilus TaxID=2545709 RepID=A0AAF0AWV1_9SCHI|nr:Nebulin-family actin filament anchoring protein Cyk3 [Schizosaccharomyces osmophilus]WBW74117.1 Nebulin-family actin filament anchoring protein Cyk3 [Schizosaccharomyces osmophilus]
MSVPKQLPCMVRALYAWPGEREGDLSFENGELIECQSLGDGKWWIGRHINTNTQGIFPSNFVQVLNISTSRPNSSISRRSSLSSRISAEDSGSPLTSSGPELPAKNLRGTSPLFFQKRKDSGLSPKKEQHGSFLKTLSRPSSVFSRRSRASSVHSRESESGRSKRSGNAKDSTRTSPSPIRSAMENVLESLNAMGGKSTIRSATPVSGQMPLNTDQDFNPMFKSLPSPSAHGKVKHLQPPASSISDIKQTDSLAPETPPSLSNRGPFHRRFQSTPTPILRPISTLVPQTNASQLTNPHLDVQRPSTAQSFRKKSSGFFKKTFKKILSRSSSTKRIPFSSYPSQSSMATSTASPSSVHQRTVRPASPQTMASVKEDLRRTTTYTQSDLNKKRQETFDNLSMPVYKPLEELENTLGNVLADGEPVEFSVGMDVHRMNFGAVDKKTRFFNSPKINLDLRDFVRNYLVKGIESPLQQMRAVYIYVSEHVSYVDHSANGKSFRSARDVYLSGKGTPLEVALLVKEMLQGLDIWCEVIEGYLKSPDDIYYTRDIKVNHAWNVVTFNDEVRLLDASFASPTHPQQVLKSSVANNFYFLMKPNECLYTHVPENPDQQFIMPDLPMPIVMALPWVSSVYFDSGLRLRSYESSILHLSDYQFLQIDVEAPKEIECVAEVDNFSSPPSAPDFSKSHKHVLVQTFLEKKNLRVVRIKAMMPLNSKLAVLRIYAGRTGVASPAKTVPHPMAVSIPFAHHGKNKAFEFLSRYPIPQCPNVDLYISSPQCGILRAGVKYDFCITAYSSSETEILTTKLAIQTPTGSILRLHEEFSNDRITRSVLSSAINETGEYRALILAEKIGRWVVYATWKGV